MMRRASSSGERDSSAASGVPQTLKYEPSDFSGKSREEPRICRIVRGGRAAKKRRGPPEVGNDHLVFRVGAVDESATALPASIAARTRNAVAMVDPMSIDSTRGASSGHGAWLRRPDRAPTGRRRPASDGGRAASRRPSPSFRPCPVRRRKPAAVPADPREQVAIRVERGDPGDEASLRSARRRSPTGRISKNSDCQTLRVLLPEPRGRAGSSRGYPRGFSRMKIIGNAVHDERDDVQDGRGSQRVRPLEPLVYAR